MDESLFWVRSIFKLNHFKCFTRQFLFIFFNKTELVLRPAEGGCIWIAELVRMEHLNYLFFWFRSFQWIDSTCSEKHYEQFFYSDWTGLSGSCWNIEHRLKQVWFIWKPVSNIKIWCYYWSDHPSIKLPTMGQLPF